MSIWLNAFGSPKAFSTTCRSGFEPRIAYQLPPSPWASSAISRRKFIASRMLLSASPTAASKARVL